MLEDLEDYQESTMALGHARIGRVDQTLGQQGISLTLKKKNQAMSDQIQERRIACWIRSY